MKNRKHWKLTALAAMALFFVGAGVASVDTASAQAEIAEGSIVTVTTSDGVTTGYSDFERALDDAEGGTVTLLQNVELSQWVTTYISYTLDLNGYSITSTNSDCAIIFQVYGGEMKIMDSSEAQTGTIYQTNNTSNSIIYVQSSLVVESGNFISKHDVISSYGDVAITINGGTFYGESEYCDFLFTDNGGGTMTFNGGTYKGLYILDMDYEKKYAYLADCLGEGMCYGIPLEEQQTKIEGNVTVQPHNYVDGVCVCGDRLKLAVTVDGETEMYKDLESAINAANEAESATLTLLDNVDGGNESYWIIDTALTVDVAGYTLSGVSLPINSQERNVSIVFEDSSEEQTGKIIGISGLTLATVHGGSITVNSGNFENVVFAVAHFATEEAFIEINGGTFDQLELDVSGGSATVNDFVAKEILIYNRNGGVEFKGGTFHNADIRESTMQDILADGYKLVNQDGVFVDCNTSDLGDYEWDETSGEYIYYETFTVVEHKTCTYELRWDEEYHWTACDCGATEDGGEPVKEAHKGGTATCQAQAACEVCGEEYGELGGHTVDKNWDKDDTHHWKGCAYGVEGGSCQETFEKAEHVYGEWVETKPATETEKGEKEKSCLCGHSVTEEIPMLDPKPEDSETSEKPVDSEETETSEKPVDSEEAETSESEEGGSGGGCGSSVAASGLAIVAAMAVGVVVRKRKDSL